MSDIEDRLRQIARHHLESQIRVREHEDMGLSFRINDPDVSDEEKSQAINRRVQIAYELEQLRQLLAEPN